MPPGEEAAEAEFSENGRGACMRVRSELPPRRGGPDRLDPSLPSSGSAPLWPESIAGVPCGPGGLRGCVLC